MTQVHLAALLLARLLGAPTLPVCQPVQAVTFAHTGAVRGLAQCTVYVDATRAYDVVERRGGGVHVVRWNPATYEIR